MQIDTIMVLGAGVMGRGIAHAAAAAGLKALLYDARPEAVHDAIEAIRNRLDMRIERGKITSEERDRIMSKIVVSKTLDEASGADFIIESVSEDLSIKQDLFAALDPLCGPDVIFATNTSMLPINSMARSSGRPDRFIGMHFFNPAPVMELVEVIRGTVTSDATYAATAALAERLGKTVVRAPNLPGFIVSRILSAMNKEACAIAMEGASPEEIDTAMKLGCGYPMGPFELMDLAGLDTCLSVGENLFRMTGDPKTMPSLMVRNMVDAGFLGRKSGRGFYDYTKQ